MKNDPQPDSDLILYQTEDGRTRVQCRFENETVWLTQRLMAELFQIGVGTVNHHLKAIFAEGELATAATIRRYRIVQTEGGRQITREVEHYQLDDQLFGQFQRCHNILSGSTCWHTPMKLALSVPGFSGQHHRMLFNSNDPACGSGGMAEVGRMNYEGIKRPQRPDQAVRPSRHPLVRQSAKNNRSTGAGQTTPPLGNLRWGELPRSPSWSEQSRIHREVRRLPARTRRIRLLGWNCSSMDTVCTRCMPTSRCKATGPATTKAFPGRER